MEKKTNYFKPSIAFHPGETLQEILDELGMGPKEFAVRTDKPEKTIIAVLKGRSSITPDMAIVFEQVLKIPAHFWLNKQRNYDEFLARKEREKTLSQSADWARQFPYADMAKKGWVKATRKAEEKADELLKFFGFSNASAWEKYYFEQELKVNFRISLVHTKQPHAISAWLRKGELQAEELAAPSFDEKSFKAILPKLKNIMAEQPEDFFEQIQKLCLENGVKVVYTPCVQKAPINGCTRWINDNPLIQLSDRYKRNDIFWFTFFHEIGHILLHGKKDIFLSNVKDIDADRQKEDEANEFAKKWTLSEEEEAEILEKYEWSQEDIINFAEKFNTHPAIIIGRLQHRGIINHSQGTEFIVPVSLEK